MKRRISIIVLFLFFMGLLPTQIVKAATSIEAQMTVNGVTYSTSGNVSLANGARRTYKEYNYKTSREDQVSILAYLKSLPYYIYLDSEDVLICHADVNGSRGSTGYSVSDY